MLIDKALILLNFTLFFYIYRYFSYKLKTLNEYRIDNRLLNKDMKRVREYFVLVLLAVIIVNISWYTYLTKERNFNVSKSYFRENGFNSIENIINENVPVKGAYKVLYTDLELDPNGDIANLHLSLMCNNGYDNLEYYISIGKESRYVSGGIQSEGYSRLSTGFINKQYTDTKSEYVDADIFFKNLGVFYEKTIKDVAKEKGAHTYLRVTSIGNEKMHPEEINYLNSITELYAIQGGEIVKSKVNKRIQNGINVVVKDREPSIEATIEGVKPKKVSKEAINEEDKNIVDENELKEYMNVYFDVVSEGI